MKHNPSRLLMAISDLSYSMSAAASYQDWDEYEEYADRYDRLMRAWRILEKWGAK